MRAPGERALRVDSSSLLSLSLAVLDRWPAALDAEDDARLMPTLPPCRVMSTVCLLPRTKTQVRRTQPLQPAPWSAFNKLD